MKVNHDLVLTFKTCVNEDNDCLILRHDFHYISVTPRDYAHYKPSAEDLANNANFRFRGFPARNFETPREQPLRTSIATEEPSKISEKHYGLPNLFDTR